MTKDISGSSSVCVPGCWPCK